MSYLRYKPSRPQLGQNALDPMAHHWLPACCLLPQLLAPLNPQPLILLQLPLPLRRLSLPLFLLFSLRLLLGMCLCSYLLEASLLLVLLGPVLLLCAAWTSCLCKRRLLGGCTINVLCSGGGRWKLQSMTGNKNQWRENGQLWGGRRLGGGRD